MGTPESEIQIFLNHLGGFATDFLPLIVLTGLLLLYSVYFGRDRFAPLIAGLYAALVLYTAFPYTLAVLAGPLAKVLFFGALTVLTTFAFSGLSHFMARAGSSLLSSIILSIAVAGFLTAISLHTLPVTEVYHFNAATKALFATNQAFFWWLAAPLVAVFFFGS
ncbi:MAG: hypothetical protein JO026_03185 [Patescibacteria group bacterium]|nr:hypothetical protein [Patescibacteria group bacterium]